VATNQRLLNSALLVGSMTLFAKVAGALKELVVAYGFGTAPELGAFILAAMFPAFLINVISGALQVAFVPRYLAVKAGAGSPQAAALAARFSMLTLMLMALVVLVVTPVCYLLLGRVASGFNEGTLALCRMLMLLLMPTAIVSGVAALWTSLLNAENHFRFTALVPLVTPTCIVLVLAASGRPWSVETLVAGAAVGALLEVLLLGRRVRALGFRRFSQPSLNDEADRHILGQFLPAAAANVLMAGSMLVEQSFAATVSAGDVVAYSFGTRLTAVVATVLVTTLSTVLLPHFSRLTAASGVAGLRGALAPVVLGTLAVSVPAAGLFWLASDSITALVFQRGNFDAADAALVSSIQAVHGLYIPVFALGMVAVRLVNAMSASRVLMVGSALNLAASVALNAALVPRVGVVGIAWANVGMYMVSAMFLWAFVLCAMRAGRPIDQEGLSK
jgi:putative peptidoglycan lipid II flippase